MYKHLSEKNILKIKKRKKFLGNLIIIFRWLFFLLVLIFVLIVGFIFFYKGIDNKVEKNDLMIYSSFKKSNGN